MVGVNARVTTDVIWSHWKDLGVKPIMTWIELFQVVQFFLKETDKREIDPEAIDIKSEVDARIGFRENKEHIEDILTLIAPPIRDPDELLRQELDRLAKDTEFLILSEKEASKLRRFEGKAERLAKRVGELEAKREKERGEAAESIERLERELAAAPTIKLRIMSDFKEGIVEFTAGQIVETKDRGWALAKVREGLAEEISPEEEVPVAPPPKVPVIPPEKGIVNDTVAQLQHIAFTRIADAGLKWIERRGSVERDINISKALYADLPVKEAKIKAVARLERLLETFAPKKVVPPKRPPRAPRRVEFVPILELPRRVKLVTRTCWVCRETFTSDIDLEDRLRRNDISRFPADFYELCPEHKKERYGYSSIEEAVAYRLVESRDTAWKKTGLRGMRIITKARLQIIGLTDADIAKIQAIEAERWRP